MRKFKRAVLAAAIAVGGVGVGSQVAHAELCSTIQDRTLNPDKAQWTCSGKGAWYFRGWMLCKAPFPSNATQGHYTPWHFKGKVVTKLTFTGSCNSTYPNVVDTDWQSIPV